MTIEKYTMPEVVLVRQVQIAGLLESFRAPLVLLPCSWLNGDPCIGHCELEREILHRVQSSR
jgi:hypothetical protein